MIRFFKFISQYNVMLLVVFLILVPGFLFIYLTLIGEKYMFKWVSSNYRLYGFTAPSAEFPPNFEFKQVATHDFQKVAEQKINNALPLKSWMIRISNQFYYSVFKTSYSLENNIIIGKNSYAFEYPYIQSYCHRDKIPVDLKKLTKWADQLKELSLFFEKRNKTFVYLITPNKAEIMYDKIPRRYHCGSYYENVGLNNLEKLLIERKIPFVNAAQLIADANPQSEIPFFPKGGTHWNDLGGMVTINALIEKINQVGNIHLTPIKFRYRASRHPIGTDHDLISLMNLMKPNKDYVVPEIILDHLIPTQSNVSASFVADSFIEKINSVLNRTHTFSYMHSYRYFKIQEYDYEFGKKTNKHDVDPDFSKVISDIINTDVVVLEENSSNYVSNHGILFYEMMKKYAFL